MPIHDTDPERRNLVITSLCFIIFIFADGQIASSEVKLQIINVSFNSPTVLVIFAWIFLLWFALRFWILNSDKFVPAFREELKGLHTNKAVILYVTHKLKRQYQKPQGISISYITYDGSSVNIFVYEILKGTWEDGKLTTHQKTLLPLLRVEGILGFIMLCWLCLNLMIKKPSFGNLIMPIILFVIAVLAGLYDLLLQKGVIVAMRLIIHSFTNSIYLP